MSQLLSPQVAKTSFEMFSLERVSFLPGAIDTGCVRELRQEIESPASDMWLPESNRWTQCRQSGDEPQLSFNRLANPDHPAVRPFSRFYRDLMREYRFLMEVDPSGIFDPRSLSTHGVLKAIANHYPHGGGMAEHVDNNFLHGGLVAAFATQPHVLKVKGRQTAYNFEMEAGDAVVTPVDIYTGSAIALGEAFFPPHEVPVNTAEDDYTLVVTTKLGTDFRDRPIRSTASL